MTAVSVIVPAYNAERTIEAAIQSIVQQRYDGDIEIIVVDDDSSDRTADVVATVAEQVQGIRLLRNERTRGPSGARNTGLDNAAGMFIAFLDADDIWYPDHVEAGIGFLQCHDEHDLVFFNSDMRNFQTGESKGCWFSRRKFLNIVRTRDVGDGYQSIDEFLLKALLNESFLLMQSMVVRMHTVQGIRFNEKVTYSEDRDFGIRLLLDGSARFAFKDLVTSVHYRDNDGLTTESIANKLALASDEVTLFIGYLSRPEMDADAIQFIRAKLFQRRMAICYGNRRIRKHYRSMLSLLQSVRYGIAIKQQLMVAAKILVSALLAVVSRRVSGK